MTGNRTRIAVEQFLARDRPTCAWGHEMLYTAELQELRAALDDDYPKARPGVAAQRPAQGWGHT